MKSGCIRNVEHWEWYEQNASRRDTAKLWEAFNEEKYRIGLGFNHPDSRAWRQVVRRELRARELGT